MTAHPRTTLAAQQALLLDALEGQTAGDFDSHRLKTVAASLAIKRLKSVECVAPALARELGSTLADHWSEFALANPATEVASGLTDVLHLAGRLPAVPLDASIEVASIDAQWASRQGQIQRVRFGHSIRASSDGFRVKAYALPGQRLRLTYSR